MLVCWQKPCKGDGSGLRGIGAKGFRGSKGSRSSRGSSDRRFFRSIQEVQHAVATYETSGAFGTCETLLDVPFHLTFNVFLFDTFALIVQFLAFSETDLDLDEILIIKEET